MRALDAADWRAAEAGLDTHGLAVLPRLLDAAACRIWADGGCAPAGLLEQLREGLLPLARRWAAALGTAPPAAQPAARTIPVVRLQSGEQRALERTADAAGAFPLQAVLLLSAPDEDFEGGELVLVEQRPRMQSRPIVVPLHQGDVALFALHERPVQGTRGIYRTLLKQAVSRVRRGERLAASLRWG